MGDDRGEREKPSWSELDRRRSQPRSRNDDHPRGRAGRERAANEQREALRAADALFAGDPGGEAGTELAAAVRDAHGSAGLGEACRAYVAELGVPRGEDLLSIFLDSGERDLIVPALEQLEALRRKGRLEIRAGLRLQLRGLAEHVDDEIAGRSEDLLAG